MGIQDAQRDIVQVVPNSALGLGFLGSYGIDLNENFGGGHVPRKAPLISQSGEELVLQCYLDGGELAAAFGTPIIQVHAVLSTTGIINSGSFVSSGTYVAIGAADAPHQLVGSAHYWGWKVGQLLVGDRFHIRLNPWTKPMGFSTAGAAVDPKDLRYFGIIISTANYAAGVHEFANTNAFINARVVKHSDVISDPTQFAWPAGRTMVG